MYNRYVRNDAGGYRRVDARRNEPSQDHTAPHRKTQAQHGNPVDDTHRSTGFSLPGGLFGKDGLISGILEKLNLNNLDTGDLLLLVLLFLLFREGEDEELLIALGLLLIM